MELDEHEWWERFSKIADEQWLLTRVLNRIVRSDYLRELETFLYVEGGKALDAGCGAGWVGLRLADKGMWLVGIDFSRRQLDTACRKAAESSLPNTAFILGRITEIPGEGFDSAVIHATLHHLVDKEIENTLASIRESLNENGRLYVYEPLAPNGGFSICKLFSMAVFLLAYSPWFILNWLAVHLRIGPREFRQAVTDGWTGFSPDERPLNKQHLLSQIEDAGFLITRQPRYWHAYSIAFAMGCTLLGPLWSRLASPYVRLLYLLDRIVLSSPLRDHVYGAWVFASILATKKPAHCGPRSPKLAAATPSCE